MSYCFSIIERTQIVVKPKNHSVSEGASVDLHCKATADPSQELIYVWKRDGADIIGNLNIVWLEEENVLRIKDITFKETGVYTCLVYTPKPRGSEDSALAIVSITGEVYCEPLFRERLSGKVQATIRKVLWVVLSSLFFREI